MLLSMIIVGEDHHDKHQGGKWGAKPHDRRCKERSVMLRGEVIFDAAGATANSCCRKILWSRWVLEWRILGWGIGALYWLQWAQAVHNHILLCQMHWFFSPSDQHSMRQQSLLPHVHCLVLQEHWCCNGEWGVFAVDLASKSNGRGQKVDTQWTVDPPTTYEEWPAEPEWYICNSPNRSVLWVGAKVAKDQYFKEYYGVSPPLIISIVRNILNEHDQFLRMAR